jgi:hypothetical protein
MIRRILLTTMTMKKAANCSWNALRLQSYPESYIKKLNIIPFSGHLRNPRTICELVCQICKRFTRLRAFNKVLFFNIFKLKSQADTHLCCNHVCCHTLFPFGRLVSEMELEKGFQKRCGSRLPRLVLSHICKRKRRPLPATCFGVFEVAI